MKTFHTAENTQNTAQMAQPVTSFRTTTPSTHPPHWQIKYTYIKILYGVDLQHTVHMSTSQQFQSANQVNLEAAFKEEIKSLLKLGILEEVKEHTDWVNSYVIVEKTQGITICQTTQSRRN